MFKRFINVCTGPCACVWARFCVCMLMHFKAVFRWDSISNGKMLISVDENGKQT